MLTEFNAFCFHIAGGDFTYRWVTGNTYEIKMTLYRDCSNPAGSDFDDSIIVAVYNKANNLFVDSIIMTLDHKDSLSLSGAGCIPPPQVCMQYGEYVDILTLPANTAGYYIVWERCCRNNTVINIIHPERAGMAFYAELPDPALHSSSPVFNGHPLPYICENQFFRFSFQAFDADGDSLVYVLSTPLDGGHTSQSDPNPFSINQNNPNPIAPLPAPYTNVAWASGFGLNNICGSNLPLTLNSATGEVEVTPDLQGIFAMAVEVKEYRNGQLIGLVRREIEFTVIACTGNDAPYVFQPNPSVQQINVYATDTISFDLKAIDADGDSIFIIHSGNIFQDAPTIGIDPPYASFNNISGIDSLATSFYWATGCQHISIEPYLVRIEASDNGCPLIMTSVRKFDIMVNPPPNVAKSKLLCIEHLDVNSIKITRVSDANNIKRYFDHFTLYRSVNGSAFSPIKIITEMDPVAIYDSSAIENKINDYCYVLSSFNNCGMEGERSDTLCSVSHINTHKNYIESVSVIAENKIQLKWESFTSSPYATYYIYRKSDDDESFQFVQSMNQYNGNTWTDHDALTNKHSYCYAMMNEDVCANRSDTSLIACSILLKGESSPFINKLNWTEYVNWKGGVDKYEILRKGVNDVTGYDIAASIQSDLIYFDRDMPVNNGSFNYYIKATEGDGGHAATSVSNEIVLSQSPLFYIPSAFTPNNDGVNDNFKNMGSFIDQFEFYIYNRWGQLVFSCSNLNEHWDGKLNGKPSPAGVYFYKLKYKGFNDKNNTEKSGSITLFR